MASSCPTRTVIPSSKLGPDNASEMELTAHRRAISKAKGNSKNPIPTLTPTLPELTTASSSSQLEQATQPPDPDNASSSSAPITKPTRKQFANVLSDESLSESSASPTPSPQGKPKKKNKKKKATQSACQSNYSISRHLYRQRPCHKQCG